MRKVFVWNQRNVDHIAKHGVRPSEAEYVVDHASARYPQKVGDGKYVVCGKTRAGRWLRVIFIYLDDDEVDVELLTLAQKVLFEEGADALYVIHAMDIDPR